MSIVRRTNANRAPPATRQHHSPSVRADPWRAFTVHLESAAERAIRKAWPQEPDREEVRQQIRKLRFWPTRAPTDETGRRFDLNWSLLRAYPKAKIYELRLAGKIGGKSNIRAIFVVRARVVHVLTVLIKKRQEFTRHDLATFRHGRGNALAHVG
jgi:hypothetical protein